MKKGKYYIITIIGALLFAAGLYLIKTISNPLGIMKTAPYLCIGIGCGMFGHGLGNIINKMAIKKHPALAKQIEIDTKDERNIMIGNTAKSKGYDMMTYVFAALLLAYSLMGASFTIIIPFVIAYLFVQFYAIYHRIKIDKEQ